MDKGIEALIAEMKVKAEKATSGEWWSDVVECDGTYGDPDNEAEGFHSYAVYDSNNQTLLDMTNSTAACIQVDCDDESHYAWDEVAERNAEYIVLARPENILKLIAALEQAQQEYQAIEQKLINAAVYIETLESEPRKTNLKLLNEIAGLKRKCAELEDRTLSFKLPDPSSKAFWGGSGKNETFYPSTYKVWVKEGIERAGVIAGIKVEVK